MKIILTQKSEVRPISDDETEIIPQKHFELEVQKYTAINTESKNISFLDFDGNPCIEQVLGMGIVQIDPNQPQLDLYNLPRLIKVAISEVENRMMVFEYIPGFLNYTMLDVL